MAKITRLFRNAHRLLSVEIDEDVPQESCAVNAHLREDGVLVVDSVHWGKAQQGGQG